MWRHVVSATILTALATSHASATTATYTYAEGVNDLGQVTGYFDDGQGIAVAAFVESGGVYTTIAVPGSLQTIAYGVNDSGIVAGQGGRGSFTYQNGGFTYYRDPVAPGQTYGYAINAHGDVAGYYYGGVGDTFHGFVDASGTFTTLNDPSATDGTIVMGLNDSGDTVGDYFRPGRVGFVDIGGTFTDLADPDAAAGSTFPTGVNDSDEVVGYYGGDGVNGFTYVAGVYTTIDDPLADPGATVVEGVNNEGVLTGYYTRGHSTYGFIDTDGVFTTLSDPDAVPVPTIPEPGAWALAVLGVGLTGAALRRRRALGQGPARAAA